MLTIMPLTALGQAVDTVDATPAAPALITSAAGPPTMVAPVIPEDVALKCSFDPTYQVYRCSQPGWWSEPSVYIVAIIGFGALAIGYLVGAYQPVKKLFSEVKQGLSI